MVVVYVVAALLYQHAFRQFPVSQRVGSWKPKCIHPSHLWWRGCLGGIWESVWKGWHGITVLDHLPPSWAPDWNGGENSQLVPSSGKEEGCFRVRVVWLTELEDSNLGFKQWLVWTLRSSVKSIFLGVIPVYCLYAYLERKVICCQLEFGKQLADVCAWLEGVGFWCGILHELLKVAVDSSPSIVGFLSRYRHVPTLHAETVQHLPTSLCVQGGPNYRLIWKVRQVL